MKKQILLLTFFTCISFISNAQWQKTNFPVVNCPYNDNWVKCIAASGSNLYVGMENCDDVYTSTNNGDSWVISNEIMLSVWALTVSGSNIFAGTDNGVFSSSNNGINWTISANNGLTYHYVWSLASFGSNLFAGTSAGSHGGGVFVSTDNGANWTAGNGLSYVGYSSIVTDGTNIFAGTESDSIFLSTNNGLNWSCVSNGLPTGYNIIRSLVIQGNNIYAGIEGAGIFLSTNNGANWNAINNGLISNYVESLVNSGSNIFAGIYGSGGGVFISTNNGVNWTSINDGLTDDTLISKLAINGTNIYAGTANGNVWKRPLSEIIGIDELLNNNNISIYPNPVVDKINIIKQSTNTKNNLLSIYNMQGQLIIRRSIMQEKTEINLSELSKGVYILKLINSESTAVVKFVKE